MIVFYFSSFKEKYSADASKVYFSVKFISKKDIRENLDKSNISINVNRGISSINKAKSSNNNGEKISESTKEEFNTQIEKYLDIIDNVGEKGKEKNKIAEKIFYRDKIDIAEIDKELRGGKPGVPKERPDSPQLRLERGIADAFVGYSESIIDHYTSPDGIVYTRTTKNGRSSCFMSGGSNVIPSVIRSGSTGKSVNCPPPGSGWEK